MTFYLLAGLLALVAIFLVAVLRRGLFDSRAKRKLSNWKRASQAWALTEQDEIKPFKVGGATDAAGRCDRQTGADPDQERDPGRSATASPIPMVQRQIELRALLDAAMETARLSPELHPIVIHSHQADRHGEEIRN